MLADNGTAAGRPNPPASCAGVNPRGSSSSASGFPCVSTTTRSSTRSSSRAGSADSKSSRASRWAERLDRQLRQSREGVTELARREQERDPLRHQPASHERERACRRSVEPLRVIHDAEQRPLLRGLGQEPQHRQSDEERIRRSPAARPKAMAQRVALGLRQVLHELEDRRAQLLQRRERQLHLRLDAGGPHDAELRRRLDRPLEQGGLADARLSVHDRDAGLPPLARGGQQLVEHLRSRCRPTSCPPGSLVTTPTCGAPVISWQSMTERAARVAD